MKPLLYVFRVLLTGIHLMRTGVIEANLVTLNDEFKLSFIGELIERKLSGPEKGPLEGEDAGKFRAEYERLVAELESARDASDLPEAPSGRAALNDLLIRARSWIP